MRSWSRASALAASCALLAGCGGQSFAERVQAICIRDAKRPRVELRELRALRDARATPLVRALRDELDYAEWLRVGALSGDSEMAMSATNLGHRASARKQAAAAALRAPACGSAGR